MRIWLRDIRYHRGTKVRIPIFFFCPLQRNNCDTFSLRIPVIYFFIRGNLKEAIELFDKALALGRTEMELTHIFSLKDAAKTQLTVTERLGLDLSTLSSLQGLS